MPQVPQYAKYFSKEYTAIRKVFLCKIYRNAQSVFMQNIPQCAK